MKWLDSDDINKIYMSVAKGIPFEETGYKGQEALDAYNEILKELEEAPEGVMPYPINEWAGDEHDHIVEQVYQSLYGTESKGSYQVSKDDRRDGL